MDGETNKLKIRLKISEISQEESDRVLFALFDFLFRDNTPGNEEKISTTP